MQTEGAPLRKIAVIHAKSGSGSLLRLANAFAVGARSVRGTTAVLFAADALTDASWKTIETMDAIVFGSVASRTGISPDFEGFAQRARGHKWTGKLAGGFTSLGAGEEEQLATLHYLESLATSLAMSWQPARAAAPLAAPPQTSVADRLESWRAGIARSQAGEGRVKGDLIAAERYGQQIAQAVHAEYSAPGDPIGP